MKTKLQPSNADYKKLSDEELIYRFAHRQDRTAANFLFDRYGHLILGVCFKYFKEKENAKDATQQIFIKLLDDLPRFQIDNFKAWLVQVTKNYCLMQLRKTNPIVSQNDFFEYSDMESEDNWHQKIEEENLYNHLDIAINELNKEQRICVELFYLQKMTYAEISAKTNCTFQDVKSHLQNGKRNLKIKMEALADVRK